ncbi:MAG: DUF1622 domain-containing protein [Clostridia bacterium]|nr:DUF1622 domain-containing protein [Clostridia bacterium]
MQVFENIYESLEHVFTIVVQFSILLMELIGVVIIIWTVVQCIHCMISKKNRNLRLLLAHGIAFALEFKLGGEVLRTILARDFKEIGMIACVIALRAALTFLLHWEVREEHEEDEAGRNELDIAVVHKNSPKQEKK